jgi:hypothetical protein
MGHFQPPLTTTTSMSTDRARSRLRFGTRIRPSRRNSLERASRTGFCTRLDVGASDIIRFRTSEPPPHPGHSTSLQLHTHSGHLPIRGLGLAGAASRFESPAGRSSSARHPVTWGRHRAITGFPTSPSAEQGHCSVGLRSRGTAIRSRERIARSIVRGGRGRAGALSGTL